MSDLIEMLLSQRQKRSLRLLLGFVVAYQFESGLKTYQFSNYQETHILVGAQPQPSSPQPRPQWGSRLDSYSLCSLCSRSAPWSRLALRNVVLKARSTILQRNAVYRAQVTCLKKLTISSLNILRRINHRANCRCHDQDNSWPSHHRLRQSPWQPRVFSSNPWVGGHRAAKLSRSPHWDSQSWCQSGLSADTGRETHCFEIWKRNRGESWGVHHRVLCRLVSLSKYIKGSFSLV